MQYLCITSISKYSALTLIEPPKIELLCAVTLLPLQHGRTALSYASEKGETLVVQELVQSGADTNIQSKVSSV